MQLKDHLLLVTGSSSGIGKAIALYANAYGARVIISGRNKEKLDQVKAEAENKDAIFIEAFNLTENIGKNSQWLTTLAHKYGKINSLVLSAALRETNKFMSESYDASLSLFETNYFSQMELCKGFQAKSCFHVNNPSITWISSITSLMGSKGIVSYSASKGAINSAVRALAIENTNKKIRVNAVLPGIVKTPMIEKEVAVFTTEAMELLEQEYPLGLGYPEDIAELVCFLISEKARWITGQTIIIDGGRSLL